MDLDDLVRQHKQDQEVEAVWEELSAIPLNHRQETEQDFRSPGQDWYYPRGTNKRLIWHDINLAHSQGILSIIEKRIRGWEAQVTTRQASHSS